MSHTNTIFNIEEKMRKKTVFDENTGCWLYMGERGHKGHGRIQLDYRGTLVHRISAKLFLGLEDIRDLSILVLHKTNCPNPNCWNPDHLYLGNYQDNARDTITTGHNVNLNKTHCKNGHEFSLLNTKIALTGERVCITCYQERYLKNK